MPLAPLRLLVPLIFGLVLAARLSATTSGADFLLLEPAARAAAAGGAFAAASKQTECLRYNPAGIAGLGGLSASVAHLSAAGDWSHEWAALVGQAGPVDLGLELLVSSMTPFELYDISGRDIGTAVVGSQNAMAALAFPVLGWLDVGVGLRLFRSQLHTFTSEGIAVDLGLQARQPTWPVAYGIALQNLGTESAYFLTPDPLPLSLRAGLEGRAQLDRDFLLRPRGDLLYFLDKSRPLELRAGVEAEFYREAFLRAGILRAGTYQQLSLGAGFRWENLSVDYAFEPGNELGNSQMIELQIASH